MGFVAGYKTVKITRGSDFWSFVLYETPILDDEPKPHKFACSGRPLKSQRPRNG